MCIFISGCSFLFQLSISVFVPVPYWIDDDNFVVKLVKQVDSFWSSLLSKDCFDYSRLFAISIQIVKLFVIFL